MHIQERLHKLSNTKIFVQQAGNSENVILLIHGFLGSTFSWRFLIPILGAHFTVYAVDLPGFGRSDKGKRYPYTLSAYAQSLYDFLQSEGVRRLMIIAHSMGGQVAMRLASLAPQAVKRLILIAPSGYLPAAKRWQKALFSIPLSYSLVPFMLTSKRIQREFTNIIFNLNTVDLQSMYDGYITPLKDRHFPRALFHFARSREDDLCREELQKVKQPTLLLWGRHDRVVPLHIGQRLVQDLPDARLVIIEDTGHLPMEEKPHHVMEHVTPFLQQTVVEAFTSV